MRKYCQVASLRFSLEMADSCPLWGRLGNYTPFETASAGTDLLFDLSAGPDSFVGLDKFRQIPLGDVEKDMPRIDVYDGENSWLFQMAPTQQAPICGQLLCSHDFRKGRLFFQPESGDSQRIFCINNALMLMFAFRTSTLGTLEMHASVIRNSGKGFLFLGKSGTGKSTHSRLWQEAFADARLLNDDNPVLRLLDNGEVRVYGSPWSGKTPCYVNKDVPVGSIVKLSQAPQNEIHPLRLPEAYAYMLSSCSGLKIVPEMMDALYTTIAGIIQTIQVYHLDCLPNTDAARLCEATVNK